LGYNIINDSKEQLFFTVPYVKVFRKLKKKLLINTG